LQHELAHVNHQAHDHNHNAAEEDIIRKSLGKFIACLGTTGRQVQSSGPYQRV